MVSPVAEQEAKAVYSNLMVEAKERIEGIDVALKCPQLSERLKADFCVLQIRFICESIALGCLAAHGDYTETHTTKFRDQWRANEIMRRLSDLNPTFFPIAMTQKIISEGQFHLEPRSGALTKDEFVRLYGRCGDYLHIGTFSDLLEDKKSSFPMPEIVDSGRRLNELLSIHTIMLLDETKVIGCVLRNRAQNGRVTIFTGLPDSAEPLEP
jgi:hypothetical protein